ncbi:MAG: DUF4287 domain-containing protein [Cytophagales bacterium]|nr:MAG: DUF4287 domain-containing protein [Cytophagales bacterium]TAF59833.1 MAG: DUF4287 domain-containing protein [Cytophagales bacterium]
MSKSVQEQEREFLEDIEQITGIDYEAWAELMRGNSLNKKNDIIAWLKSHHKLNHLHANILAAVYLNGGKPVHLTEKEILNALFEKKENMRDFYTEVLQKILDFVPDTVVTPSKGYVLLQGSRDFGLINIRSKEIRLGLDLGDIPLDDETLEWGNFLGQPRMKHMIIIREIQDLTQTVYDYIQAAVVRSQRPKGV